MLPRCKHLFALMLVIASLLPGNIAAETVSSGEVWVLGIDGVINPLSARYLQTHIEAAQQATPPEAIILELNTPGGLESSMREMSQAILNSSVPFIVYVTPPGARAASAGLFITAAAHIAAMAPGTNIGAAHPVNLGGEQKKGLGQSPMSEKVTHDAAAFARSIAEKRGRNVRWIESAVRDSVSITASEARNMGVIDRVSEDRTKLLRDIHDTNIFLASGARTLNTRLAKVVEKPMNFAERILHAITDPNIAYLLMTLGFIGIIAELYSPGMIFPGVTGVISLILAFAATGSLPINWAGVALLAIGIALLIFELQTVGVGFLGIGAVVAFVLGSLILYRPLEPVSPSLPRVAVNSWLLGAVTVFIFAFLTLVLRALIKTRHLPIISGSQAMVGQTGVVSSELAPFGRVKVGSEEWSAILAPEHGSTLPHLQTLPAGSVIEVVAVEGVTLKVRQARVGRGLQAS